MSLKLIGVAPRSLSGLAGRLAGMGLTVGSRVEVLQNRGHGPVLGRVRETRIGLGRGEAAKVLVEEVPP